MPLEYSKLAPDSDYLVQLGSGVWLMDNHKWALVAWERQRIDGKRYVLLHADFHWDGVDDFWPDDSPREELLAAGVDELVAMTAAEKHIKFDSFIAPAVRRNLLSEVHFFCKENDGNEVGLDADLCDRARVQQVVHDDVDSLAQVALDPANPLIFDLCLDLFNQANDIEFEGDLWSDSDVLDFLEATSWHIRKAAVVTISLSFGFSGSEEDTRHLAQLVVPRILELRSMPR
ncbi:UPF0489 family protein [Ideonella paludis]|uniref:UPF0489 family protein n=1 Tax=Ideonella paludis TaxID=1233411 RepID=A0ABS5E2B9_9BURK|nr:UPF0489 family protein [Ideonella paludis]MBQ0937560.1 UPF0489 family protein [Ideonella paludis]